jgi:putative flippase GtrA
MHVARFAIAGAVSTLFAMFSFPIVYEEIFRRNYFDLSYVLSCALNLSLSFTLQRYFVFQSNRSILKEFVRFIFGALFLMLIGYIIVWYLVRYFTFNIYLVNVFVVLIIAIASFLWHKLITFGELNAN